jgi:hypothetical protein
LDRPLFPHDGLRGFTLKYDAKMYAQRCIGKMRSNVKHKLLA